MALALAWSLWRMSRRPAGRENRIADEYRIALRDLTFNSKPIINNLTFFAQENVAHAAVLSRVLSDHLVNVGSSPLCTVTNAAYPAVVPPRYQITSTLPDRLYMQKYW